MTTSGNESRPDDDEERRPTISELFRDGRVIDAALRRAAQEALLRHKKLGIPIAVWRDGEVLEIPPEEIPVSP